MSQKKLPLKSALSVLLAALTLFALGGCQKEIPDTPPLPSADTEPTATVTEPPTLPTEDITQPTLPPEPEPLEKYLEYYEQNNDFVG